MALTFEQVIGAFAPSERSGSADYRIVDADGASRSSYLAMSREGRPTLLIPLTEVPPIATRLTHGLSLHGASAIEFSHGEKRWKNSAAVIQCREPSLDRAFAGMVVALVPRLERPAPITWEFVLSLFEEWELLLGRRKLLSAEAELGAWGELWILFRSSRVPELLAAWRGPEGDTVDYLIDGVGFEIKTTSHKNVHMLSQAQVDAPLGKAPVNFVSLFAKPDPVRGRRLPDLVNDLATRVVDVAAFEQKLAGLGYSRSDEAAYVRPYCLIEAPSIYQPENIPRVRAADEGISQLRYRAVLAKEKAVPLAELARLTGILGINSMTMDFPCV